MLELSLEKSVKNKKLSIILHVFNRTGLQGGRAIGGCSWSPLAISLVCGSVRHYLEEAREVWKMVIHFHMYFSTDVI